MTPFAVKITDNKKTDDIKSDTSETQTANAKEVKTKVADDVEKKKW